MQRKRKSLQLIKQKQSMIYVSGHKLERVNCFEYLGALLTKDGNIMKEIKRRQNIALQKIKKLSKLWKITGIKTKLRFLRACIFPIATYGCETWTIDKAAEKSICAFEYKCYRRILRISLCNN